MRRLDCGKRHAQICPLGSFWPSGPQPTGTISIDFYLGELTYEEQARARVREVIDSSLSDAGADRCFSRYIEIYERAWSVFPDVEACLMALSRHRLGVVSNGQREQQVKKLVRTGIFERFECIVVPGDCGQPKPNAGIFHHACGLANERPEQTAYMGDAYDLDAVAAREAGMIGVWLDRNQASVATASPACHPIS